jgi:hypothetical protein
MYGLGQHRTGRGMAWLVEPTTPRRQDRASHSAQEQPMGTAEKPTGPQQRPAHHRGRYRENNHPLYRAHLLKEQLREVFATKGATGKQLLTGWLSWATRSRIPEFVSLAKTIKHFLPLIHPRPRPRKRAVRGHEHPPTSADPPRLGLPQRQSTHRHGHPHPRRTLPTPTRTILKPNPQEQQ